MSQESIKKRKSSILIVWLVPLLALVMTGWMLYKHFDEKGVDIIVKFDSAKGFTEGKTALNYKGIKIGLVKSIDVNPENLDEFFVTITIEKGPAKLVARQGTQFWKVEPKVSITEVSGLDTLLSGSYIEVIPIANTFDDISKGTHQYNFIGIHEKPIDEFSKGRYIKISSQKGDLNIGAPILFKKFLVGEILKKELIDREIIYTALIEDKYKNLVKEDSHFWNLSGIELKASLSGIKVELGNIASLLAGGVMFDSPESSSVVTKNHKVYPLYKTDDDIGLNPNVITLRAEEGYSLQSDMSAIYFNGIHAGVVKEVEYHPNRDMTFVKIQLKDEFYALLNHESYFKIVIPHLSLQEVEGLDAIARGPYIKLNVGERLAEIKSEYILNTSDKEVDGFEIVLKSQKAVSLKKGVGIFYKGFEIGEVTSVKLQNSTNDVIVKASIDKKSSHLINSSSLFYLQSPLEFEASLDHMYIKSAPISSMIHGGISFITPLVKANKGKHFELFEGYSKVMSRRYLLSGGEQFILLLDELGSLSKGDPIYYKNIKAGEVMGYNYDFDKNKISVELYVDEKFSKLVNSSTHFYNVSGVQIEMNRDNISIQTQSLQTIVQGGLAFITLDREAKRVTQSHKFKLYSDVHAADEKDIIFEIKMSRGYDLKKGSALIYKDMKIGRVSSLRFEADEIVAKVSLLRKHENILKSDSLFYLEKFEAGLGGIKNAGAAVFGPSIHVSIGGALDTQKEFVLSLEKPSPFYGKKGLRIVVKGDRKSSLKQSSPVYYRQVQIGSIESYVLGSNAQNVELTLFIEDKYRHLVRENSIFYNATAFGMTIGLTGVKISTETVATMMKGGIGMVIPNEPEGQAQEGKAFKLHLKPKSDWFEFSPEVTR